MATFLIGGISLTPELVNLFFGDSTSTLEIEASLTPAGCDRGAPPTAALKEFQIREKTRQTESPVGSVKSLLRKAPRNRMPA